jgi:type IV fimbrial biogenesis protein FimT
MDGEHGFTLTELLLVVLIVAVAIALATPAWRNLRLDLARSREIDSWLQSIHLARSEAIKRNAVATICPSTDGQSCLGAGQWAKGRLVFANLTVEQPPVRDESDPVVRVFPAWEGGRILANRNSLSFRPFGQSGVTATLVFCDVRGASAARALIISQNGRPRIATTKSSGEPLACD